MQLAVGEELDGRYLLRREIARSPRTLVFEAQHLLTRRPVALKVLRSAHDFGECDALVAEARLLAELSHPCIVQALDAGRLRTPSGSFAQPYLVMELLEGRSVAGTLAARGRLEVRHAVEVGLALADALACMHRSSAIHRDLTPANVFLFEKPRRRTAWVRESEVPAKLIGFGASVHALTRDARGEEEQLADRAPYLAPEQLQGSEPDERSDVYSLGAILYECLTGELPIFRGGQVTPPSELRSETPPSLGRAIVRALAIAPEERFASAHELGHALHEARSVAPPSAARSEATRRRHSRAAYLTPVRITRRSGETLDGRSEDVSEGGLLVIGPQGLDDGERVEVRFAVPISGEIVTVPSIARWRRAARDGKGALGLAFEQLPPHVRLAVGRYVSFFAD